MLHLVKPGRPGLVVKGVDSIISKKAVHVVGTWVVKGLKEELMKVILPYPA